MIKKRVAVVSLYGLYNFGNRLQGFAVDHMLKSRGLSPTTVVFYRKLGVSRLKAMVSRRISRVLRTRQNRRSLHFENFVSQQDIQFINFPWQISRLAAKFDFFVVGSDQVWNPKADLYKRTRFLEFAAPMQRVALAPSIGVNELSPEDQVQYKRALSEFRMLSVRERSAAQMLANELELTVEVLPDPTFGLTAEEWSAVACYDQNPAEPYIFLYFLGGRSERAREVTDAWSQRLQMRVVDISDAATSAWQSGPQHFIALISQAHLVLTDSFHAAVFSSIYERPFYVFKRDEEVSTFSRLETLLGDLELTDRQGDHLTGSANDWALALPNCSTKVSRQRTKLQIYIGRAFGDG